MGKTAPSAEEAIEAGRVARDAAKLRVAQRALDHAYQGAAKLTPEARRRLAEEGDLLARALAAQGATLAALSEFQRACALGRKEAREGTELIAADYVKWRPTPGAIGAPRDSLLAGASGAFWVSDKARARVAALEGGITGEGTESFGRILDLCARDVQWVLVDMERLTYVGSAGLAVAVKLAERLRGGAGGLAMFSMSPNLKLLVETLGLAHFLNPAANVLEAIDRAAEPT